MPKRSLGNGKRRNHASPGQRQTLDVSGFLNKMGLPVPRLPFLIGSDKNLSAGKSVYPKMVKLDFPIIPQFLTLATGALAQSIALNLTLINLGTPLASVFAEYAIIGAKLELRVNATATPQGIYLAFIDEKSGGAPTAAVALDAPHIEGAISNTESPSAHMISWKAADFLDLDWTSLTVSETPAWLKVFASTSATGTSASTGAQIMITGALALCLRGYVGQN
jgi:hypothetical protein